MWYNRCSVLPLLSVLLIILVDIESVSRTLSKHQFRFGIIADIQYVNDADALNFQGTKIRRYRQSLEIYRQAVESWNLLAEPTLACSIVLGDMLDGKSAALNSSQLCWDQIQAILNTQKSDTYFCFGNHDFYSFSREEIFTRMLKSKLPNYSAQQLYYDWKPHPGWRFVSVDSYDISQIAASSKENVDIANAWLAKHNPNDLTVGGTWFNGLAFDMRRWVPYNGGVGDKQLKWFNDVLADAARNGERVAVFSHQPVLAPEKPQSVIWNAESLMDVMAKHGNVRLWMAGHDHGGQYQRDESTGIHHLVPPAPIECGEGETAFGHIDVHDKLLRLHWTGRVPSKTVHPFPVDTDMHIE